jgi:hypothetical protein
VRADETTRPLLVLTTDVHWRICSHHDPASWIPLRREAVSPAEISAAVQPFKDQVLTWVASLNLVKDAIIARRGRHNRARSAPRFLSVGVRDLISRGQGSNSSLQMGRSLHYDIRYKQMSQQLKRMPPSSLSIFPPLNINFKVLIRKPEV